MSHDEWQRKNPGLVHSCPSRTRAPLNNSVVCSCPHTDLMSPFYYGDMCQENPTACTGGKEGRKRGDLGDGKKASSESEASVKPFPITP